MFFAGFATIGAIGSAEVLAELSVALVADRVGLTRFMAVTSVGTMIFYFVLSSMDNASLGVSIFGMFLAIGFFETAVVASFALAPNVVPEVLTCACLYANIAWPFNILFCRPPRLSQPFSPRRLSLDFSLVRLLVMPCGNMVRSRQLAW